MGKHMHGSLKKKRFAPAVNVDALDVGSVVHQDDIDKWTEENECMSVTWIRPDRQLDMTKVSKACYDIRL